MLRCPEVNDRRKELPLSGLENIVKRPLTKIYERGVWDLQS